MVRLTTTPKHLLLIIFFTLLRLTNPFYIKSVGTTSSKELSRYCINKKTPIALFQLIPGIRLQGSSYLFANKDQEDDPYYIAEDNVGLFITQNEGFLAPLGLVASIIMLYSEFVLSQTGCGLPAGPAGLVGATEGLSYLTVLLIVSLSIYSKVTTGKGLPPGPNALLGGAEGLSFLAVAAGLVVLVLQITNFGFIPNAIPMEGGMCK